MRPTLFLVGMIVLASACATNPALETFPDRRIDRTLENSQKVTDWSVLALGGLSRSSQGVETNTAPFPWPFYFQNPAVTNALSHFDQGLFGADVGIPNEEGNFSVASLSWAPANDAVFGFNNQFTFGLTRRQHAGPDHALDYGVAVTDLLFDEGFSVYLARFNLAAEWQLGDHLWVRPGVGAWVFHYPGAQKVIGTYRYFLSEGFTTEFPLTIEGALDFNKLWGLRAGYSFYRLGRTNGSWDQKYYFGMSVIY